MARCRRWTNEENDLIRKKIGEGASVSEIAVSLPDRTAGAVEQEIRRLGLKKVVCVSEKNFSFTGIRAERIIEREEALKILAGALERLREGGEMQEAELDRIRTINAVIRNYFAVFNSYEKYAELEARLNRLAKAMGVDLEKDSENSAGQDHQNGERQR